MGNKNKIINNKETLSMNQHRTNCIAQYQGYKKLKKNNGVFVSK